jgi:hypothetical protein
MELKVLVIGAGMDTPCRERFDTHDVYRSQRFSYRPGSQESQFFPQMVIYGQLTILLGWYRVHSFRTTSRGEEPAERLGDVSALGCGFPFAVLADRAQGTAEGDHGRPFLQRKR